MDAVTKAMATQLENIQKKAGMDLEGLFAKLRETGLEKHGELVKWVKDEMGLGHGDANTLVHVYRDPSRLDVLKGGGVDTGDALAEIYKGKEDLRPIHDAFMARVGELGEFEIAPKKANVSLRRKKQFALIGPKTKTRFEVGLNMKGVAGTERLEEQKPGGMCQYIVKLNSVDEVDDELMGWVKLAFESAG